MADFDPSMLCSVEITAERDSDSTPTPRGQPLKKKRKLVSYCFRLSQRVFTWSKKVEIRITIFRARVPLLLDQPLLEAR